MNQQLDTFWSISVSDVFERVHANAGGLTISEAAARQERYGSNLLKPKKKSGNLALLIGQFKSPIMTILLFAAGLSFFLHDRTDTLIILTIVLVSGLLGFWQERGATNAIKKLLSIVQVKAAVLRDGQEMEIPTEEVVPGDIVILNAGDVVPGDCLILESKDLFIDEATLTGETFPVEKTAGIAAADAPLGQRLNTLFMATHVVSGNAKAVVVHTGQETEFGKVSERLKLRPPETDFEHGIRRFGYLLTEVTMVLVLTIFAVNVFLKRPVLDSFLFSLALAIGLTPQMLPAIISINLAYGTKNMARLKVIVKRLAAIENFGTMNVLCSDKTGTLTEGIVHVESALDPEGRESERTLLHAYINASYETGFTNPIDDAIRTYRKFDISSYKKLDEVPYDFIRKRLSILVAKDNTHIVITKGALTNVLAVCSSAEAPGGGTANLSQMAGQIQQQFEEVSRQGFRVLGVAMRDVGAQATMTRDHEADMTFLGFLVLSDPPKPGIIDTINELKQLGTSLKVITGDNHLVAANVGQQIGFPHPRMLTGPDLHQLSDGALLKQVNDTDVFAEVEPNQKERILLALKKAGNVVGYMGDGINDASALHTADVGISVDTAVDVAKEAADIVLLEKDLKVLIQGVKEGRKTFANTLKYVLMATSANFGNMFSMAGASLFLPFLPLLPKQILLTNLMTDFPEMTIASDGVDVEMVEKPRRWDIAFIRRFMLIFGLVSSVFDYLTFGVLLLILHATLEQFRTGWFIESVISAAVIVLVVRTRRPFIKSRPGRYLLITTLSVAVAALVLPFTPVAKPLGFGSLPPFVLFLMLLIVGLYILAAEIAKAFFYKRVNNHT
jgi:Mg2+-importing ATPase